jgi:hypothetical protein
MTLHTANPVKTPVVTVTLVLYIGGHIYKSLSNGYGERQSTRNVQLVTCTSPTISACVLASRDVRRPEQHAPGSQEAHACTCACGHGRLDWGSLT